MDKQVVRRVIKRLESKPESYDQTVFFVQEDTASPCGSVACLAGEVVICSAATVEEGIKLAVDNFNAIPDMAANLLGISGNHGIFDKYGFGWPRLYREALRQASTRRAKAEVAVAYLKEALKRGTMIWETENTDVN